MSRCMELQVECVPFAHQSWIAEAGVYLPFRGNRATIIKLCFSEARNKIWNVQMLQFFNPRTSSKAFYAIQVKWSIS